MELEFTKKALEKAKEAVAKKNDPNIFLRFGVKGAGCSGFSYVMMFDDTIREGKDLVETFDGLKVVVDKKSMVYLTGTVVDYETKLMGHGFQIKNPNEKHRCSCGESFGF
jgi:iron-sulfur cluster assembly protein